MVWIGLEGTDGVGKSTLAQAIAEELQARVADGTLPQGNVEVIHKGPPEKSVLEEYATDVEGREGDHLVFDRWHLGTLVYAPLYRSTGPFGELGIAGFRWVEKFLQARGVVVYVADLPYDIVKTRLETCGEDYLQSRHVEGVLDRFREVRDLSAIAAPAFTMPETLDEVPALAKNIVQDAAENARDHAPLRAFPSYVGGITPKVLLVGERRGGKPPFASQAAFMPLKNKSGEYLWDALPDRFWTGVGVANAYEDDVTALYEVLGQPAVVALGGRAALALRRAGIKHGTVPHPQYVKRFLHKNQELYGELIAEVAENQENKLSWRV